MAVDGTLFVASAGLTYGTGGMLSLYDKPYCTMAATTLLEGSRTLLHEACAPDGKKQALTSKVIEKSILGLSFLASAATSIVLMAKAIPALAGGAAVAAGTFCVGALGASVYQGYRAFTGNKTHELKKPSPGIDSPTKYRTHQQGAELAQAQQRQQDHNFAQEVLKRPKVTAFSQNKAAYKPMMTSNPVTKTEFFIYKDSSGRTIVAPSTPELRKAIEAVLRQLTPTLTSSQRTSHKSLPAASLKPPSRPMSTPHTPRI